MKSVGATIMVFGTSAAVLVLEILAGRLMAPYVGISLETFTGIIGTVLAGIATGAAAGGHLADTQDPRQMIGPGLVLGGVLTWLSLPIVSALGPDVGSGPVGIIVLTGAAFFLPAAVLSSISPMVAKLRLSNLEETGTVIGGLSAAGTVGALAGTFITGFVLVAALPSRPIVIFLGAVLVLAGAVFHWRGQRRRPALSSLALVVVAAGLAVSSDGPCQHETAYFCVRVEVDADHPSGRSLYLDRLRHAYVDLDDPTFLDIRYIRLFADVADAFPAGPLDSLHIGGGGFTFPRYVQHTRPGSRDLVLEIDDALVAIAKDELGLVLGDGLEVRVGDARLAVDDLATDSRDLVIGDAFGSASVPWHLTTTEMIAEIERILRPGGIYVMNVIDAGDSRFARAELATLAEHFDHLALVLPREGVSPSRGVNHVLLGSNQPLPPFDIALADGQLLTGQPLVEFIDGASALRDDFAPVDQLMEL